MNEDFVVAFTDKQFDILIKITAGIMGFIFLITGSASVYLAMEENEPFILIPGILAPAIITFITVLVFIIKREKSFRLIVKRDSLILNRKNKTPEAIQRSKINSFREYITVKSDRYVVINYRSMTGQDKKLKVGLVYENYELLVERLAEWFGESV